MQRNGNKRMALVSVEKCGGQYCALIKRESRAPSDLPLSEALVARAIKFYGSCEMGKLACYEITRLFLSLSRAHHANCHGMPAPESQTAGKLLRPSLSVTIWLVMKVIILVNIN